MCLNSQTWNSLLIRIIEGSAIGLGPLNLKIQKYYAKSSEEHPRVADKTFKLVGRTFVPYFFYLFKYSIQMHDGFKLLIF